MKLLEVCIYMARLNFQREREREREPASKSLDV
jgi:hypothetical protein